MEAEHQYLMILKLFLVAGPLLGFGALELILLRRDKRRDAKARAGRPESAGVQDAARGRG